MAVHLLLLYVPAVLLVLQSPSIDSGGLARYHQWHRWTNGGHAGGCDTRVSHVLLHTRVPQNHQHRKQQPQAKLSGRTNGVRLSALVVMRAFQTSVID